LLRELQGVPLVYRLYDRQKDKDRLEFQGLPYNRGYMDFQFYRTPEGERYVVNELKDIIAELYGDNDVNEDAGLEKRIELLFPMVTTPKDVETMAELIGKAEAAFIAEKMAVYSQENMDESLPDETIREIRELVRNIPIRMMLENRLGIRKAPKLIETALLLGLNIVGVNIGTNDLESDISNVSRDDISGIDLQRETYGDFLLHIYLAAVAARDAGISLSLCGNHSSRRRTLSVMMYIARLVPRLQMTLSNSGKRIPTTLCDMQYYAEEGMRSNEDLLEQVFKGFESLDEISEYKEIRDALIVSATGAQAAIKKYAIEKGFLNTAASGIVSEKTPLGGIDLSEVEGSFDVRALSSALVQPPFDTVMFAGFTFQVEGAVPLRTPREFEAFIR